MTTTAILVALTNIPMKLPVGNGLYLIYGPENGPFTMTSALPITDQNGYGIELTGGTDELIWVRPLVRQPARQVHVTPERYPLTPRNITAVTGNCEVVTSEFLETHFRMKIFEGFSVNVTREQMVVCPACGRQQRFVLAGTPTMKCPRLTCGTPLPELTIPFVHTL